MDISTKESETSMSFLKYFSQSSTSKKQGNTKVGEEELWVDEELAKMAEDDKELAGNLMRIGGKNRMSVSRSGRFKSKQRDRKHISEDNFDNNNSSSEIVPDHNVISQPTFTYQTPPNKSSHTIRPALQLTPTRKELQNGRKIDLNSGGTFFQTSC